MTKAKSIKPLPYPVYFWTAVALACAGLLNSIYLTLSHYRVYTDIGYRSMCAISRSLNCETVSQSPYSIFWGLPVPLWGIFGYGLLLGLLALARCSKAAPQRIWSLMIMITGAYSIYGVILAWISYRYIHSYCIMCVMGYGINFALLFHSWLVWRRLADERLLGALRKDTALLWSLRKGSLALLTGFVLVVGATHWAMPAYWNFSFESVNPDVPTGITADGHPWIGAPDPTLTIVEFSDYQCFQCRKMHQFLRQLVSRHPDAIRLVHRHYPMDHEYNPLVKEPFHVGSGKMALLAIYAAGQGKFWPMNDLLYQIAGDHQQIDLRFLAKKLDMDARKLAQAVFDPQIRSQLWQDIQKGLQKGITATPGYLIDEEVYLAQIPPQVIKDAIE